MWIKIKTKEKILYGQVQGFHFDDEEDITVVINSFTERTKLAHIEQMIVDGKVMQSPYTKENIEKFLDYHVIGIVTCKPMDVKEAIDNLKVNNPYRPANLADFRLPNASRGPDTYFTNRDSAHVNKD